MSKLRFSDENYITQALIDGSSVLATSEDTDFPIDNIVNTYRNKYLMATGSFTIDSTNKKLYINDGADKTITMTEANYNPSGLASHIQTQLNASSSGWSCSYSSTSKKFTISRGSSATIRWTVTTDSIATTIGFATGSDETGTSFVGDEARIHWYESITIDFGSATEPDLFFIAAPKDFPWLSSSAVLKLQANSSNSWASPALDITLDFDSHKSAYNLEAQTSRNYRYWRLYVQDYTNTAMAYFRLSYMFLGSYIELTDRNIGNGFTKTFNDRSLVFETEHGVKSFTDYPVQEIYSGLVIPFMTKGGREELLSFFNSKKKSIPFLTMFDPDLNVSNDYNDLSVWGRLINLPTIAHVRGQYFNIEFQVEEHL